MPPAQFGAAGFEQALPHVPQFCESFCRDLQPLGQQRRLPPHGWLPFVGQTQAPLAHCGATMLEHVLPQVPQFVGSAVVSLQMPPPAGQHVSATPAQGAVEPQRQVLALH